METTSHLNNANLSNKLVMNSECQTVIDSFEPSSHHSGEEATLANNKPREEKEVQSLKEGDRADQESELVLKSNSVVNEVSVLTIDKCPPEQTDQQQENPFRESSMQPIYEQQVLVVNNKAEEPSKPDGEKNVKLEQEHEQEQNQQDKTDECSKEEPTADINSTEDMKASQEVGKNEQSVLAKPSSEDHHSMTVNQESATNHSTSTHDDSIASDHLEQWLGEDEAEEVASCEMLEEEEGEGDDDDNENQSLEVDYCCQETGSHSTLRKLKLSALEDALVCEQSRHTLNNARQLFNGVAFKQQQSNQHLPKVELNDTGSSTAPSMIGQRDQLRSGSLSSADDASEGGLSTGSPESTGSTSNNEQLFDVKIVRRSGSSVSNSNSFRQTLVCSVSPVNQLNGSTPDVNGEQTHPLYPMEGEEILQCRAAFRQNRRLIEQQQVKVSNSNQIQTPDSDSEQQARCSSSASNRFARDFLEQSQSKCSHCDKRLYPLDKLELDFTRTTLNIHRNCFKCAVCNTLLRLETYAALDAKLYCPTHIKSVTPSR